MNKIPYDPDRGSREFEVETPVRERLAALTPTWRQISDAEFQAATRALTECVVRDCTLYLRWLVSNSEREVVVGAYNFEAGMAIAIALDRILVDGPEPIEDAEDYAHILCRSIESIGDADYVDYVLDRLRQFLSVQYGRQGG